MLKITDLSYRYQSRQQFTLHRINLELEPGGMLLLAGRSGCGKSTLIKAISGLLSEQGGGELHGHIYLQGEEITRESPEKIGILVGTVYQSPDDQLFAMNVADEVGFALENQGLAPDFIQQQVRETLALVGLAGMEGYGIHQLSGGQRQRLALASILITKPKLLILDEPVSQMNPQGVQQFMQLLLRLNQQEQLGILMIEHRVNELAGYFQRLAVMQEGRIVYDGPMEEAWSPVEDVALSGLREPQNVKLCRLLGLSRLSFQEQVVEELVRRECQLKPQTKAFHLQTSTRQEVLVEAKDLVYTYPGAAAPTLRGLSFSLYAGQITALMGFNGAGKSTLLDLLGGLNKLQQGQIFLGGKPLHDCLGQVGYLRQEPDLMLLADTVLEEIAWKNKSLSRSEAESLLQRLNLQEYAEDFPLGLSKGQRLRLVLGAMLAKRPRLILLDEPTTGQDEASLTEIKNLLLDFQKQGGSVFICTHDVELAAEISSRVLLLQQGRFIADGPTRQVLGQKELLQRGGLVVPSLVRVCEALGLPPCITAEEVGHYVSASVMGGC